MDNNKIRIASRLKSTCTGWRIFSTEFRRSSIPTYMITIETRRDATYSNRPCPRGCSSSAGIVLSIEPAIAMIDVNESLRLLKESEIIAILLAMTPITSLDKNKKRFNTKPKVPDRAIYFACTPGSDVF